MTEGLEATKQPLFSGRVLIVAAVLAEVALIMCFCAMSADRGWSLPVFANLFFATFLAVLVVGDIIRWRFRISLLAFLGFVTFAAVCSAMFGVRLLNAAKQKRTVAAVVAAGGYASYDFTLEAGWLKTKNGWMFPGWAVRWFGKDMFGDVSDVLFWAFDDHQLERFDLTLLRSVPSLSFRPSKFSPPPRPPPRLTDVGVAYLAQLTHLEELSLAQSAITDDGLAYLDEMKELESLFLYMTAISDAGLQHLYKHKQLKVLNLSRSAVTPKGVADLQIALPECHIFFR